MLELNKLTAMRHDFGLAWKHLILTDLVYKAIAFVVLTPLVSLLLRVALAFSGRKVLSDQDILTFLLGPMGWFALILVCSAIVAIVVLEQAALLTVVAGAVQEKHVSVRSALSATIPLTIPILPIVAKLLAIGLATISPFLLAIWGVYSIMLNQYDINYYLATKPPIFWLAAVSVGLISITGVIVLLRVLLPVIYALPIFLFEGVDAKLALSASRKKAVGNLRPLVGWFIAWSSILLFISVTSTTLVRLFARLILPLANSSLIVALIIVGLLLLLWACINLGLAVLLTTSFAVMLVNLYRSVTPQRKPVLEYKVHSNNELSFLFCLSRLQWIAVFIVILVAAVVVGTITLNSVETDDDTQIAAHRGASAAAPENSMAAIEQAITDRADWVEVDVQESSDGVVMVIHDEDLKRLAGKDIIVWDSSAEELQQIDIGEKFSPEFAGQTIPTLQEVLAACKDKIGVLIELKHYGRDQNLEQRVVDLVEQLQMQEHIQIMSLKYESIQKVRALRPDWPVGLLSAVAVGNLTLVDADFLAVSTRIATQPFINSARHREKAVYVWTVNDPIVMSTMISRGTKSIITDKPALARKVLDQRDGMDTVERMILKLGIFFGQRRNHFTDEQ